MRDIEEVLLFRSDISPFLVHLTRDRSESSADNALRSILHSMTLTQGPGALSDARFGMRTSDLGDEEKKSIFGAICFTETPLNEIHCLLNISARSIQLAPYGLVFLKKGLREKGVSPVFYVNNEMADKDTLFAALCSLKTGHFNEARKLLPLISVFGQKIQPPGASSRSSGSVDFLWEREWRYPNVMGDLSFEAENVFVGLCPDQEIASFERAFPAFKFIDPTHNPKLYAQKLISERQRLDLKYSVV